MTDELRQEALLRAAHIQRYQGNVPDAVDLYLTVLCDYPTGRAAEEALSALLEVAQTYEAQGHGTVAQALYHKLEQLIQA